MTERLRNPRATYTPDKEKMGSKKTAVVFVVVVGCFAVLWPKVFYPMLVGSANQHIKPSPIDRQSAIRQERPPHLRAEIIHPAFRERGRAITQPQSSLLPARPPPRIVSGRKEESKVNAKPGPIPGLRPTIGGAGHVVPAKQQSVGGSIGLIMPIYTIAIVVFFSYTVIKLFTKKKPETGNLYPHMEPDPVFRREVFETQHTAAHPNLREGVSSKLVVNAMSALLDEVDEELEARRKASQLAQETHVLNGTLSNGNVVIPEEEEQTSVKVLGLEVTASRKDDKKWNRPSSPLVSNTLSTNNDPQSPTKEIFLEGALPAQSHLLVADSTTELDNERGDNEAVVLASKMTLSVISLDSSENGTDESSSDKKSEQMVMVEDDDIRGSSNGSDDFEKIEADQLLEDQINDIIEEAQIINEFETKNTAMLEELPIHTDIKVSHPAQGQLVEDIEERILLKRTKSTEKEGNNIVEIKEIVELETVLIEGITKEMKQIDEKEKAVDKTKSSASSETVEDVEELLSRGDEVGEANDEIEYEESDNGSEEDLDDAHKDKRISEERENEEVIVIKKNKDTLELNEAVDDVDGVQETVTYEDDDEDVEEEEIVEVIEEEVEEEEESENKS
ncbi:unnamed protein product [Brassicogethes aeneus]|uniref:Resistance to inhibitors of cholinesterase protein 3 N-terminal domain-containing protein n=1 Tax=Brassicogethes aeneus TaxID=1431903 RepID=A0A9P0FEV4_BRAAE|nr:unnamed protein product [Brassicogethes aeneus]